MHTDGNFHPCDRRHQAVKLKLTHPLISTMVRSGLFPRHFSSQPPYALCIAFPDRLGDRPWEKSPILCVSGFTISCKQFLTPLTVFLYFHSESNIATSIIIVHVDVTVPTGSKRVVIGIHFTPRLALYTTHCSSAA